MLAYTPGNLATPVDLFAATDSLHKDSKPGWSDLFDTRLQVHRVEGTHVNIMKIATN